MSKPSTVFGLRSVLKGSNLVFKTHNVAQLVHALEQTGLGKRVDWEGNGLPAGQRCRLGFQVNRDLGIGCFFRQVKERLVCLSIHNDGQQAILEGIVTKDVGEGGADDGSESVAGQRPGRMLAARSCLQLTGFARPDIWDC